MFNLFLNLVKRRGMGTGTWTHQITDKLETLWGEFFYSKKRKKKRIQRLLARDP